MERNEAAEALALLRKVVARARDDSAQQNWGLIWMVHAFSNGGGFIATNLLLWEGVEDWKPYGGMWTGILAFNFVSIFLLRRKAGVRSFVDRQIWSIWNTFIAAVILLAILNQLMGLRVGYLAPVVGVMAAVGFASMGAVIHRVWFLPALVFAGSSVAMALLPHWQFVILGVMWGGCQFVAGWILHRAKKNPAPRLV